LDDLSVLSKELYRVKDIFDEGGYGEVDVDDVFCAANLDLLLKENKDYLESRAREGWKDGKGKKEHRDIWGLTTHPQLVRPIFKEKPELARGVIQKGGKDELAKILAKSFESAAYGYIGWYGDHAPSPDRRNRKAYKERGKTLMRISKDEKFRKWAIDVLKDKKKGYPGMVTVGVREFAECIKNKTKKVWIDIEEYD